MDAPSHFDESQIWHIKLLFAEIQERIEGPFTVKNRAEGFGEIFFDRRTKIISKRFTSNYHVVINGVHDIVSETKGDRLELIFRLGSPLEHERHMSFRLAKVNPGYELEGEYAGTVENTKTIENSPIKLFNEIGTFSIKAVISKA